MSKRQQLEMDLRQACDNLMGDMVRGEEWETVVDVIAGALVEGKLAGVDAGRLNIALALLDGKLKPDHCPFCHGKSRDEGVDW